ARLVNSAGDGIGDELFVPFAPGAAIVDLRDRQAGVSVAVGIDPREGAYTAGRSPRTGTLAVRNRNALAALDEGQNFPPRNDEAVERFHEAHPCRAMAAEYREVMVD